MPQKNRILDLSGHEESFSDAHELLISTLEERSLTCIVDEYETYFVILMNKLVPGRGVEAEDIYWNTPMQLWVLLSESLTKLIILQLSVADKVPREIVLPMVLLTFPTNIWVILLTNRVLSYSAMESHYLVSLVVRIVFSMFLALFVADIVNWDARSFIGFKIFLGGIIQTLLPLRILPTTRWVFSFNVTHIFIEGLFNMILVIQLQLGDISITDRALLTGNDSNGNEVQISSVGLTRDLLLLNAFLFFSNTWQEIRRKGSHALFHPPLYITSKQDFQEDDHSVEVIEGQNTVSEKQDLKQNETSKQVKDLLREKSNLKEELENSNELIVNLRDKIHSLEKAKFYELNSGESRINTTFADDV